MLYSETLMYGFLASETQELQDRISVWEGEGGSLNEAVTSGLTGTVNQIEWAERIRVQVNEEFDRVSRALESAALRQSGQDRLDTYAMMAILEDKRAEVIANQRAGYFIHDWQELRDQVRKMIMSDARYKAIKARASNPFNSPAESAR